PRNIMLDVHIVLCVVKTRLPWLPLRFGLPNVNGTRAREATKSLVPPGLSTNSPREPERGAGPLAREPTRGNLRGGAAGDRPSSGPVAEVCVASHAAPG